MSRELLIEQVVPEYRAWLRKVAVGMLSPGHEALDDLIQEGYIALWRAVASFNPDAAPADYWLKRSATQRMLTVVSRNHWTGQSKRLNGGHGGSQPPSRVLGFGELEREDGPLFDVEDVLIAAALDQAADAYHDGEIARALAALTERERQYVIARFWRGLTGPELDTLFVTAYAANIWRTARPKLRETLAHLSS